MKELSLGKGGENSLKEVRSEGGDGKKVSLELASDTRLKTQGGK